MWFLFTISTSSAVFPKHLLPIIVKQFFKLLLGQNYGSGFVIGRIINSNPPSSLMVTPEIDLVALVELRETNNLGRLTLIAISSVIHFPGLSKLTKNCS